MPQVARHLTLRELERRYKKAKDPVEKTRFQAVYHAAKGLSAKEIARITLQTPRWVHATVRRYNLLGPKPCGMGGTPTPEPGPSSPRRRP
ncbi:helix-turn-helix domain-containing protein [Thermus tengchongensis]|uniref:helix-turn-helix domain-containing protein n=1 Tax=Thermus tengchongensis TaxID=1214928 RepID=UPI000B23C45C|nr:helix-turn-helix domain-containing protein [Thermus tengchongensis]